MGNEWLAVLPTALWVGFFVGLIVVFWKKVHLILDALILRIEAGAPVGFGPVSIGSPPPALLSGAAGTATAEGASGSGTPKDVKARLLERKYPPEISDELYLVHATQVLRPYAGPGTGRYRVRVTLESYEDQSLLDEVTRVTYRLHDSFKEKVIATEARADAFELWLNIYGEINLVAYVERRDKPPLWLTRYLDLPSRPTN